MERRLRTLRSQVGKTPIQKPLCRLCECPTSDGHVLASQVDRFKLRKWAMKVMNLTEEDENLPDVVEEDALICYFCIWQAEFGDESGDEAVAWWPKNLDLEENARVLRENYSVGDVEQCWVQLEEIDLPEYEKEIPEEEERKCDSAVCLYCGKRYKRLVEHIRQMHKEVIKCGIRGCTTYFHAEEEKEHYMQHYLHEKRDSKPNESSKMSRKFCENCNVYVSVSSWRKHMNRKHPELPVACTHPGCQEYFKCKPEMILHINFWHKRGIKQKFLHCAHCEYFTAEKKHLSIHQQSKHFPKMFKCDSCNARYGSKFLVNFHYKQHHTFDLCKLCGLDVALGLKRQHTRSSVCSKKCKLKFKCSGLSQLHRKSCQKVVIRKNSGESFTRSIRRLNRHVRKLRTKFPSVHCDHCDYSTFDKYLMQRHMQTLHLPKIIKCVFCIKFFVTEFLKHHPYVQHGAARCAECAQNKIRR